MGSMDSLYIVDVAVMTSRQRRFFLWALIPGYTLALRVSEQALATEAALAAVSRADRSHLRLDASCFRAAAAGTAAVVLTGSTLERRVAEYAPALRWSLPLSRYRDQEENGTRDER